MDRRDNVAIAMSAVLTMAVVVVVLRLLGLPDLPILLWQTLTDLSVLGAPRLVALALVGGIITICVDEVGHALAASLNGVALTGVAIGPVVISSTPGRGGFTVRPRLPQTGPAGMVGPAKGQEVSRTAYGWVVIAGSLANLLFGAVLVQLARGSLADDASNQAVAGLLGVVNLIMVPISLTPVQGGPHRSDGALLLDLLHR